MALAEIIRAEDDKWYVGQIGKIIDIEDKLYRHGSKNNYIVHNPYDAKNTVYNNSTYWHMSFWESRILCKVITNLNKNKRLVINEKYKYVNYYDLKIFTKEEARKIKLKKLLQCSQ